jgi:RNA polymerase sigma-70 factor (ECF subfamily)
MGQDHRDLVRDASRGDAGAVGTLIERHLPGVLAFVRANAGGLLAREESLDLVQSACREVLADLPRTDYRDEAGFRHWLFLAAERKILDRARYHGREKRAGGREALSLSAAEAHMLERGYGGLPTPSASVIRREEIEGLERALASLSEEHRRVIVLAKIVGLAHADIARELGKSEVAVRSLLHRALARLALELGGEGAANAGG